MKILLLRDKKPGHFNQSEGVVVALARLGPIEVTRLEVRPTWFAHGDIRKRIMKSYARDSRWWLSAMFHIDAAKLEAPDVIVASGQPTIAAGILLSRLFGEVPLIHSGVIDGYELGPRVLQLVNSPRQAGDPRSAYVPIPSTINPDDYAVPRPLTSFEALRGADIALLVGGTAYRKDFPQAEWDALFALVTDVAQRFGVCWRASSSRRTPEPVTDKLAELARAGIIAEFVDYRSAGAGSARALFGADAIVVTEDSMSMLAEGLAAKRPVIGLKSQTVHKHYANEIVASMAGPSLAVLPLASVTAEQLATTLIHLVPPTEDARDVIARAIAPELGLS